MQPGELLLSKRELLLPRIGSEHALEVARARRQALGLLPWAAAEHAALLGLGGHAHLRLPLGERTRGAFRRRDCRGAGGGQDADEAQNGIRGFVPAALRPHDLRGGGHPEALPQGAREVRDVGVGERRQPALAAEHELQASAVDRAVFAERAVEFEQRRIGDGEQSVAQRDRAAVQPSGSMQRGGEPGGADAGGAFAAFEGDERRRGLAEFERTPGEVDRAVDAQVRVAKRVQRFAVGGVADVGECEVGGAEAQLQRQPRGRRGWARVAA